MGQCYRGKNDMKLEGVQSAGKARGCEDATYSERRLELLVTITPAHTIGRKGIYEAKEVENSILWTYVFELN